MIRNSSYFVKMALSSFLLSVMTMQFIASVVAVKSCEDCRDTIRKNFKKIEEDRENIEIVVLKRNNFQITLKLGSVYHLSGEVCPLSANGYEATIRVGLGQLTIYTNTKVSELEKTFLNVRSTLAGLTEFTCPNDAVLKTGNLSVLTTPSILINSQCSAKIKALTGSDVNVKSDKAVDLALETAFWVFFIKFKLSIANGQTNISELEYLPNDDEKTSNRCGSEPQNDAVNEVCECLANEIFKKSVLAAAIPSLLARYINTNEFIRVRNAANCAP